MSKDNNNVNINNFLEKAIQFAYKLGSNTNNYFNGVHRTRLVPKRLEIQIHERPLK